LALVIELSATVAFEARPVVDRAAENKRTYDREYRRTHRKNRTTSYETNDCPAPNEIDILTPTRETKTEPKCSSKSSIQREKLAAVGVCLKVAYPAPIGVADEVWRDFLASPKRRKAGMSKTAYAGICNNLAKLAEHGFPPGEMLALAVERGWVTVKLEWVMNDNERRPNTMARHQPADGLSSTARAALQVFGR
jgi:hypothetical protein